MKTPLLFIIGLFACVFANCTRFDEPVPIKEAESEVLTGPIRTRSISTGFDSLPDPYALENMQAVYDAYNVDIELEPTDLYVRIMPQDSTQLELLEDICDLDLFDYPLDLDIPEGEEYIDPTIPEGEFGWYYTTVKSDYSFPDYVVYEVIRECYIPEDDEVIETPATRSGENIIEVERAALERLGYVVEPQTRSGGGGGQHPEGYVTVRNDNGTSLPVVGVRVKVHSHTKIDKEVYTDDRGFYRTNKKFWQYNLKYTVVYLNKDKDFIIWRVTANDIPAFARAKYEVEMDKYGGNIDITASGRHWLWAAMYNAAYEYYQKCKTTGITKPPQNLKILCCPPDLAAAFGGSSNALMARRLNLGTGEGSLRKLLKNLVKTLGGESGFVADVVATVFETNGPDLIISTYDRFRNAHTYRRIYESVSHELSHASHFQQVGTVYWERYVRYIANSLLLPDGDSYGDGTGLYAGNCEVGEMWGFVMGHIRECQKFETGRLNSRYQLNFGDFSRPGDRTTSNGVNINGWIRPDPIWALITRGVLTEKEVFDCLISGVDDRVKLTSMMSAKYPSKTDLIGMAFSVNDVIQPTIAGPSSPAMDAQVEYAMSTTNLPAGMSFSGFTISGSGYTIIGAANASPLKIKFTTAGTRTITATYTLPGNVTYPVTKTVTVKDPFKPTITGTSYPTLNVATTYRVPAGADLPAGVTLDSFTVSGNQHNRTISSTDLSTGKLVVIFKATLPIVITAVYTLNNGSTYTCTKEMFGSSIPPTTLGAPVLSIAAGYPIVATVTNHKAGATYEWMRDATTLSSTGPTATITGLLKPTQPTVFIVKCRSKFNGEVSAWSASYQITVPPTGNTASIQVVQLTAAEAAAVEAEMQTQSETGSETTTDDSSEDFFSTF